MREIKFRAMGTGVSNSGKWFYFKLFRTDDLPTLDMETLGEFTGLKDKNGKEIYEGDILRMGLNRFVEVAWNNERASFNPGITWKVYEVIDNIYENSDLLK